MGIHTSTSLPLSLWIVKLLLPLWGQAGFKESQIMTEGAVLVTQGHPQRSGILHQGRLFPCSSACSHCFSAQWNGTSEPAVYHPVLEEAWKRSSCGHVHGQWPLEVTVVGSCCFLSAFQGLWLTQFVLWSWRVFSCTYRSLWVISWLTAPQGKHQPHPGTVCAWREGSLEAVNCNVTQQHFAVSPRLWPVFQHGAIGQALLLGYLVLRFGSAVQLERGCSGCFAGLVNHSGNSYQKQGCSMTEYL